MQRLQGIYLKKPQRLQGIHLKKPQRLQGIYLQATVQAPQVFALFLFSK
jgi:hypothetical protein